MPPPAKEIKHHPSAVNDLLVKQLVDAYPDLSLAKFMKTQLSSINGELASRLISALVVSMLIS
jgi:DNA topoisomerase VI subunit B